MTLYFNVYPRYIHCKIKLDWSEADSNISLVDMNIIIVLLNTTEKQQKVFTYL